MQHSTQNSHRVQSPSGTHQSGCHGISSTSCTTSIHIFKKAAGSATATTRIAPSTHPWLGHNVATNVLALRCHFLPSIVRNFGTVSNWPDRAALLFWRVQSKTRRGNCSVPSRKRLLVINNSCFCSFLANRCRRTTNYHLHNYSNTE